MIEPTDEMVHAFIRGYADADDGSSEVILNWAAERAGLAAVLAIVDRDIPVARTQIRHADRSRFAACAAPEAIAVQLRRARLAQGAAQREVEWLGGLLERRTAERDAGVWPGRAGAPGE